MSYEWIGSRWFTPGRIAPVTLIVVHTIECPLEIGMGRAAAELCARRDEKISAHYYIDPATVIQGVKETDTAYCAPGANQNGIHIEQSGRAALTTAEWHEPKAVAQHQVMAALMADISVRKNIPLLYQSAADLLGPNPTGVTTHAQVALAFHKTDHTDPGPNYPMDYVLIEARALLAPHQPPLEDEVPYLLVGLKGFANQFAMFPSGAVRQMVLAEFLYLRDTAKIPVVVDQTADGPARICAQAGIGVSDLVAA